MEFINLEGSSPLQENAGGAMNAEATDKAENAPSESSSSGKGPIVVLVIGMAGVGKTTLMHRINLYMVEQEMRGYYINLDPAVRTVPFAANIDIRDTVNYKEVMKQYGLGPNGGILTSLNLFATRFDQVVSLLEKRKDDIDYIFIDTPGQIETFTWSAGGQIIHELLASAFPTCILYVTDSPRCASPTTFMSNMLYASSVLYKSMLPMIVAFNKTDVVPCEFLEEWMTDFEAFQEALDVGSKEEYMGSFNRSLSLVMDEFYNNIKSVGVSAATGAGMSKLFVSIGESAIEFNETYLPELQRRKEARVSTEVSRQEEQLARLKIDMQGRKIEQGPR
jgi:GTPase SAR1 family protein